MLLVATQNLDSLRIFADSRDSVKQRFFQPSTFDSWAMLEYKDGKMERVEFYYGSGYLSQSTRSMVVPQTVTRIVVRDFKGNARSIDVGQLAYNPLLTENSVHRNK